MPDNYVQTSNMSKPDWSFGVPGASKKRPAGFRPWTGNKTGLGNKTAYQGNDNTLRDDAEKYNYYGSDVTEMQRRKLADPVEGPIVNQRSMDLYGKPATADGKYGYNFLGNGNTTDAPKSNLQPLPPLTDNSQSAGKLDPLPTSWPIKGDANQTQGMSAKVDSKPQDGLNNGVNKIAGSGLAGKYGKLLPMANNIVNLFRKPPAAPQPNLNPQVTLQRVNMDNDRFQTEQGIRGSNAAADKGLDENTAAAVKSYNVGQRQGQLSTINQSERNQNIDISNKENLTNANIVAGNNSKLDQYGRDKVERQNAWLNQSSANLANMSDKYIGMQNEQSKQDIENRRLGQEDRRLDIMKTMYDTNGVATRFDNKLKDKTVAGAGEVNKKFGGRMKAKYGRYSTGGMMKILNT